jgi:16S rRNA (adenine1518-N6/adenine1519-N6)-dimethyltransferase
LPFDDLSPETHALLSRQGVRQALQSLDLHPSRRLGQSFLVEPAVLYHILKAAVLSPEDAVLEVGPGLGVLTSELIRRARQVVAVELDHRLCGWLREHFTEAPHFTLVEGDILELSPGALMQGAGSYKVVANLPYAITSALLRLLLEAEPHPTRMVLMVQWEVAKRVTASPPEMSLLALSVQYYSLPEIVHRVPAGCFLPRPEVDSAILRLEVPMQPPVQVASEDFFRLARAGFSRPRRQLRNNLADGLGRPKDQVSVLLSRAGIDPRRRAETLSLEDWAALCSLF